jgi:Domain of unknown function (DUF5134)
MTGPLWPRLAFALLLGALAVRHLGCARRPARLGILRRFGDPRCAWSHALMAAGMVAMFLPTTDPLPGWCWTAAFAANAGWLGTRIAIGPDRGPMLAPATGAAVMSAMFALMPAEPSVPSPGQPAATAHAGHLAGANPAFGVLGWLAAVGFLVYTLRCGMRVAAGKAGPHGGAEGTVRLVMGLGMTYMLLGVL